MNNFQGVCISGRGREAPESLTIREENPFFSHPRNNPPIGLLVHRRLAHQHDDRDFVRHRSAHPRDTPEVLLQPLDPVRRINHRLYMWSIVQIREMKTDVFIFSQVPDGTIVFAPFQAHLLPRSHALLNSMLLQSIMYTLSLREDIIFRLPRRLFISA